MSSSLVKLLASKTDTHTVHQGGGVVWSLRNTEGLKAVMSPTKLQVSQAGCITAFSRILIR